MQLKGHNGEPVIAQINMSWATRVRRDDLVTFHVDGTHGSAVAGLQECRAQSRVATPRPVWNPDVKQTMNFFDQWQEVPDSQVYDNGFKIQWEHFIRHVVEDAPYKWTLPEGAKGVQLVEAALESWKERRWVDVPALRDLRPAMSTPRRSRCRLPTSDRRLETYTLRGTRRRGARRRRSRSTASPTRPRTSSPIRSPRSTRGCTAAIDWDATIAYRQHLWSLGLGVAEAMDTAQRGMGLDWPTSLELIRRSLDAARDVPGALVASGCGTDHLAPRRGDDASTT